MYMNYLFDRYNFKVSSLNNIIIVHTIKHHDITMIQV